MAIICWAQLATKHAARRISAFALLLCALISTVPLSSQAAPRNPAPDTVTVAQQEPTWQPDIEVKKSAPAAKTEKPPAKPSNTTVIERAGDSAAHAQLKLVALLTADGQEIDEGIVWRIYQHNGPAEAKSKLIMEKREASPALKLQPGDYTINAAFGRANLTRKLSLKAGSNATEKFVLNAGGLRVNVSISGKPAPDGSVTFSVFSDDREQFSGRSAVMTGAKPGLIIRLNAGIYHIVSSYGDANAKVEADVTVEAGKLTEAAVVHQAAKAAFKLVTRAGGEALPDTHWTIQTQAGETVKESVGALPSHVLAPGTYMVLAKYSGRIFQRTFSVSDGEMVNVEVLTEAAAPASAKATPAEVKNP